MIRRTCPVCGALMRNARHVTEADEEEANAHAPAAILDCIACPSRVVLHGTNRHRSHAERVPDQSVFEVTTP